MNDKSSLQISRVRRPVAFILTAIPDEADAVAAHLESTQQIPVGKLMFDLGEFVGTNIVWQIVLAECGPGNVPAAISVASAAAHFNPDVVLFVGIAGGLKDVRLGDVVAGTKVYGFHSGRAGERFQPRPALECADLSLEQRAKAVRRRGDWIGRIRIPRDERDLNPKAYVGPLAAGENVVSSDKSDAFGFLREYYSDALAVEMEGYGFLVAARYTGCPALVVRGISDLCAGKTASDEQGWQPRAAAHAAAFAFELLANCTPPPRLALPPEDLPRLNDDGTSKSDGQPSNDGHAPARIGATNTIETPSADQIVARFADLLLSLTSRTVSAEEWIHRPEEHQLRQLSVDENGRVLCLLGAPGSGKTATLAKIAKDAAGAGYATLAIKADQIPPTESLESWGRDQLGIGISLIDAVKSVAVDREVLVIVDQLDALASLIDLNSRRLNDLIEFIRDCSLIRRVSVICSCRGFEYRHDTRFVALDAECVNLQLPEWENIAQELEKVGLAETSSWPSSFREVLRSPQHLQIYLERFRETGNADIFRSYQNMLDDLWNRTLPTEEQRNFVYRLVDYLIETESLWAPTVQFESDLPIIEQLDAAQFIQRQDRQVGFRHQTLLEHAKARLFTKSGRSLCDHVLARQNAILVRPTLWTVLGYLRDADRPKYHQELDLLLQSQLRLHIRFLLIDFLGQVKEPDEFEILHLASRLEEPEDRLRVLVAIRGKEGWFRAFRTTHFPVVMRWESADQWPMVGVLNEAWKFAREECLRLITDIWYPNSNNDALTWNVLREIDHWDQATVDMLCRIIQRTDGNEERLWWAEDLVYVVSADQPTLAPQVFLATVSRNSAQAAPRTSHDYHSRHSPLENTNHWYELPAVAEAAPIEFLRVAWPWFVQTAESLHGGARSTVLNHYQGSLFALDPDPCHPVAPITASILIAIEETAKRDPHAFVDITRSARTVDNEPVQRVIARGFIAAAAAIPAAALEFLREDTRHFMLGSRETHNQGESSALISAISPYLNDVQRHMLEEAILRSSQYRKEVDTIDRQRIWDREARLRLLSALPKDLLSEDTYRLVQLEQQELPDWNRQREGTRSGFVKETPPLTRDEMAVASDEVVLETLRGPQESDREAREWIEAERGWTQPGGARAAAHELGLLAKSNPDRVLPLLPKMLNEGYESAAAEVIRNLTESSLNDVAAYQLICDLATLRPVTAEFRSQAGYLLYKRCREGTGLSDHLCEILKRWLTIPWHSDGDVPEESRNEEQLESEPDQPSPVLWGSGLGLIETDAAFWPLLAVTNGYLMRTPPETTKWLRILQRSLDTDIATNTWANYCSELRWICLEEGNLTLGVSVVRQLLRCHPAIKLTKQGSGFLAATSDLLPEDVVREFFEALSLSTHFIHRQTFGEVLTVIAFREQHHEWAQPLLEQQLHAIATDVDAMEAIATGIAFAAAHLWDDSQTRAESCRILCRLMANATNKVGYALGTVFWAVENFPADEFTDALLEAITGSETVLSGRFLPDLIEHLANLLPHSRRQVLNVCQAIVARRGRELTSLSYELISSGPHLVNIAMTLQRFPDTRSGGLSLLESLLRLGLDDAFAILNDIDIRPAAARRREPRKRRSRRRRA